MKNPRVLLRGFPDGRTEFFLEQLSNANPNTIMDMPIQSFSEGVSPSHSTENMATKTGYEFDVERALPTPTLSIATK
jgi:hypothetical protein